MRLSVCKVVRMRDGVLVTSYVYGPTAAEYCQTMSSGDTLSEKILSVEDVHGYKEEGRYRRVWWERDQRPTHYYFNKHLSREPISSGAGPYLVGASDESQGFGGDAGVRERQGGELPADGRSVDADGGAQ